MNVMAPVLRTVGIAFALLGSAFMVLTVLNPLLSWLVGYLM